MNSKFIKNFNIEGQLSNLPDSDYWLSREESILTYLHQRGASVPKVQMKDLIRKSLTLQNVGTSLDIFFNGTNHQEILKNSALQIYLSSILILEELLSLGVLHLDIALRNIATPDPSKQDIYILDFIHALSSHSKLQKPLPLLPTEGLHHPLLIDALNSDWKTYFGFLGKETPKLDKTLSISNEEYSRYWIDLPEVQSLCEYHPILSHGLGNLASEMANSKNIEQSARELFLDFSRILKNLDQQESYLILADTKSNIASILGADSAKGFHYTNATPIPKVHTGQIEIPKHVISEAISPALIQPSQGPASMDALAQDTITEEKNVKGVLISQKEESPKQLNSSFSFGNFLMCWGLILLNIYLIDFVVRHKRIILADEILLLVILSGLMAPIILVVGLFSSDSKRTKILSISALIAVSTELMVIGSYPNQTYSSFLSWLPSCAISIFAFLLSVSTKKNRAQ
jgi:hypothetical protein